MRYLLILTLYISLQASAFWTLSGLEKSRILIKNEAESINKTMIDKINEKVYTVLKNNKIAINVQDSPTLMFFIEEIKNKNNHYLFIRLALGEDVKTFRKSKDATFSLTYYAHDFIEVDSSELEFAVLESADFLLAQFDEQFKEDN